MQSAQNGLIVDAGAATTGTSLMMQKMSPDNHQHFCIGEDGKIIHLLSQLAVTVSSVPLKDGTPLVLKPPVLEYQAQIRKTVTLSHPSIAYLSCQSKTVELVRKSC